MPYIKKEPRPKYRDVLRTLPDIENRGDLEYCIYYLLCKYMNIREERYSELGNAVFAARHAGHEFERRRLDVREDKARNDNGDIEL